MDSPHASEYVPRWLSQGENIEHIPLAGFRFDQVRRTRQHVAVPHLRLIFTGTQTTCVFQKEDVEVNI